MASNVTSQILKLLSQVMLKAWICKAQNSLSQNSNIPQNQRKISPQVNLGEVFISCLPEISYSASQNHYKIMSRKHIPNIYILNIYYQR